MILPLHINSFIKDFQLDNLKILSQSFTFFTFTQQNQMLKSFLLISLLTIGVISSSVGAQKSLAVTIYNNDFAMVKDVRSFKFDKGASFLYFTDVSSNIQTETVTFKPVTNVGLLRIYEQNFQKNLINKQSILQKYIQKDVQLYVQLGESSKRVTGKLLGFQDGYIIKTDFGVNIFNKIDAIQFPQLPDGFFTVPTLNWKVFSQNPAQIDCEVAYRTTGFGWKSDYSLTLNSDETKADIGGWVTIDNNSGKKYVDAKLKLIAGDVNTVSQNSPYVTYAMAEMVSDSNAGAGPQFSEKAFDDYHMYTLSQTVTLNESSQKQVEFIPKVYNIPIRKYHQITINAGGYSENNLKATNKIQFLNSKSNKLGIPFPKGTVRVFKSDQADGSLQFVGEDSIDHTPKDENITLKTGNAFDLKVDKYSESRQSFDNGAYTANCNITITNHKDINAEIEVRLNQYYGDNLKIEWESPSLLSVTKESSNLYKFSKVLSPGEKFVARWSQNYYP